MFYSFIFRALGGFKRYKKYHITGDELARMLKQRKNVQITLWDGNYYFPDFRDWMKIIQDDIVHYHKYKKSVYDCDNFATTFAGLIPFLYGVNGAGIAVGRVIDEHGNVFYHAWNIFVAMKVTGEPELYMYEPQSGKFSTYKAGRIGTWRYEPMYVIWG